SPPGTEIARSSSFSPTASPIRLTPRRERSTNGSTPSPNNPMGNSSSPASSPSARANRPAATSVSSLPAGATQITTPQPALPATFSAPSPSPTPSTSRATFSYPTPATPPPSRDTRISTAAPSA